MSILETWIKEISDYCEAVGITPPDLIDFHRKGSKQGKSVKNELKIDNSPILEGVRSIPGLSIQAQAIRDKKIGVKKPEPKKDDQT